MEERWCGMKKNDWILAAAIFFVAVLTIGLQLLKTTDEYSEVEIQVNGELYGRYRLEQDQEIDVNDKNKVLIKDRKVRMEDADCPDQICVNHRAISRDGESIICLPNQTIVRSVVERNRRWMRLHGRKVAIFGVFTALALIFSYVELLIPINFGIPGAKLGLANLMTVLVLYKMGIKEALALSVTRIILSGFMFGNLFGILYSLSGGLLSFLVMVLLKKSDRFSVAGVSIGGGTAHNIGQLLVAMVVVQTYQVGYYLPVLLVAGEVTGLLIGLVAKEVLKRIQGISLV